MLSAYNTSADCSPSFLWSVFIIDVEQQIFPNSFRKKRIYSSTRNFTIIPALILAPRQIYGTKLKVFEAPAVLRGVRYLVYQSQLPNGPGEYTSRRTCLCRAVYRPPDYSGLQDPAKWVSMSRGMCDGTVSMVPWAAFGIPRRCHLQM